MDILKRMGSNFFIWSLTTLLLLSLQALPTPTLTNYIGQIGNFPLNPYNPTGETFELKNRQVENQQQSQECYLFAVTNYLQVANFNFHGNLNGHPSSPGISGPYLMAVKLFEYIDQSFKFGEARLHLAGGNVPDTFELISKYGMLPDQVWQPKVPFKLWPFETLYLEIDRSIKIHQKALKAIAKTYGESSKVYREAFTAAQFETDGILLKLTGPFPEKFEWHGKGWTPQTFAAHYGIEQARSFDLYHPPTFPLYDDESALRYLVNSSIGYFGARFSIRQREWDVIESKMKEALDQGVPIVVGVYWGYTSHVMVVVGYELRQGKIFAWKFLNSWGRWTPNGETYFKASDVRRKADQIWIIK